MLLLAAMNSITATALSKIQVLFTFVTSYSAEVSSQLQSVGKDEILSMQTTLSEQRAVSEGFFVLYNFFFSLLVLWIDRKLVYHRMILCFQHSSPRQFIGPDYYISLPTLSAHIVLLQIYLHHHICSPICTDIKTAFKGWKKCLD